MPKILKPGEEPEQPKGLALQTRVGSDIDNVILLEKLPFWLKESRRIQEGAHPLAVFRSISAIYNCVGMVFGARRTWIETDHLRMILQEDGYYQIDFQLAKVGDVVVYTDNSGEPLHVGVVIQIDKWRILSKWGQEGEYLHNIDDIPYLLGKATELWTERRTP